MLEFPYFAVGHNVKLRQGRYGNATLSRYPIVRSGNIDLTIGRHKRRGCQFTALALVDRSSRLILLDLLVQRIRRQITSDEGAVFQHDGRCSR